MIKPRYLSRENNEPIELGQAALELSGKGATFRGHGAARLRLLPHDRVIVTAVFDNPTKLLAVSNNLNTLRFGENGRPVRILIMRTSFSGDRAEMDLLPRSGHFTLCRDRRVRLSEAIFHVLNFPEFLSVGKDSTDFLHTDGTGKRWLGRVFLRDVDWCIELRATPDTARLAKSLYAEGGHAITHVGRLTRNDRRRFTISDMETVMLELHQFLSFARGLWTGIFGVAGTDGAGQTVYEDWGMRISTPWESRLGWFDAHHGLSLSQAYPGFIEILRDPDLGRSVSTALYWYLRANRAGHGAGVDGGLLLSQAALERLASGYLPKTGFSTSGTASERIRRTIKHLGIPASLQSYTPKLLAARRRKLWQDGPEAITTIRNELVHPKSRLKMKLSPLIYEAWQLSQWYFELIILRIANYAGVYANRLNPTWVGDVTPVPWTKKKS